jgi:hypothetical protein
MAEEFEMRLSVPYLTWGKEVDSVINAEAFD